MPKAGVEFSFTMYLTPEEHKALLISRREAQVLADHFKAALIRIKSASYATDIHVRNIAASALENAPHAK